MKKLGGDWPPLNDPSLRGFAVLSPRLCYWAAGRLPKVLGSALLQHQCLQHLQLRILLTKPHRLACAYLLVLWWTCCGPSGNLAQERKTFLKPLLGVRLPWRSTATRDSLPASPIPATATILRCLCWTLSSKRAAIHGRFVEVTAKCGSAMWWAMKPRVNRESGSYGRVAIHVPRVQMEDSTAKSWLTCGCFQRRNSWSFRDRWATSTIGF